MLEKFIKLVELRAKAAALELELQESEIFVCKTSSLQLLMDEPTKKVFMDFCNYIGESPIITEYIHDNITRKETGVNYKGLKIFIFESGNEI